MLAIPARYTTELTVTSLAAWIGSLPLVAYYFNIVTPVSTPANVVAVPLCVLVLISNLLSLMFAAWFPGISQLFNHAGWFGMECIRLSSEWFAHWPGAYFYTPAPAFLTSCLYYALLFAVVTGWLVRRTARAWKLGGLAAALLIWTWHGAQELSTTRLTVLPNNGGATIYCDAVGTRNDLLIDAGPSNTVQFITKPFLRAQGVSRLPALLLTHGDIHHTGGAEPLQQIFDVPCVYTNPLRFRSSVYRRALQRLGQMPGLLQPICRNASVGAWMVLHPDPADRFAKADDGAAVLRADLAGVRVLLLSDLGPDGQRALLERKGDLRADIVVAGLPTSGEPLCEALIEAVHPQVIIVADCDFPVSERASPRLRSRLRQLPVPVIYSRDAGAVTLQFRKNCWQVTTMSGLEFKGAAVREAVAANPSP